MSSPHHCRHDAYGDGVASDLNIDNRQLIDRIASVARRGGRLLEAVDAAGYGGFLCTRRANVRYLTGFTGSNGWVLFGAAGATLVTDSRYREQAADEAPDCHLIVAEAGLTDALAEPLAELTSPVAFESGDLSVAAWQELAGAHEAVEWKGCTGLVEGLRVAKETTEISSIREALTIAELALEETVAGLRPGMTEVGLAAQLEYACRGWGAERMAFDTIVAAGRRGALPHARPGLRTLRRGDLLVVDMGCEAGGYCSDITRAVVLDGQLPAKWARVHDALRAARDAALAVVAAGVAARAVDAAARQALGEWGLDGAFIHSLGHGVGLEVHEAPRLAQRSDDVLVESSVVTIEPGVYLPGEGGMRLEDLVLVEDEGAEVLNRLPPSPMFSPC